jgi:hypothetical protein
MACANIVTVPDGEGCNKWSRFLAENLHLCESCCYSDMPLVPQGDQRAPAHLHLSRDIVLVSKKISAAASDRQPGLTNPGQAVRCSLSA